MNCCGHFSPLSSLISSGLRLTSPVAELVALSWLIHSGCASSTSASRAPTSAVATSSAPVEVPEPPSWMFPEVVTAARARCPKNIEGLRFDEHGLAYTTREIDELPVLSMTPEQLQRYADVVTYAYPDASFRRGTPDCDAVPLEYVQSSALANLAFMSLNAVLPETREQASRCLQRLIERLRSEAHQGASAAPQSQRTGPQ
jgi:hypothetical protein